MAFKRSNFKTLINTRKEFFSSSYSFSKKTNFKAGSDVYVIPLGLETGFYETPCHRINTHKVDGKTIGFNGFSFAVNIKCKGIDAEGNLTSSLCCTLAKMEKERFPEKDDYAKRIIGSRSTRVHLPVLILGNSLNDDSKISYPISKVALKKDLASEGGLKFSYIDMSATTFQNEILLAYGKKLKEEGTLDYELDESSEEFMEEVVKRLSNTIIKVHGGSKQGFSAAIKEYSFFPLNNPAIANASPEGERELIVGYKKNDRIMQQISEFLVLFDAEVDSLILNWNEKDLQEYYNSAIGVPLDSPIGAQSAKKEESSSEEEVVVKKSAPVENVVEEAIKPAPSKKEATETSIDEPVNALKGSVSDEEMQDLLDNPFSDTSAEEKAKDSVDELEDYEFNPDDGDFFDE